MAVAEIVASSSLGRYESACREFAESVAQFEGVVAVGAAERETHYDLWVMCDREDAALETAVIERWGQLVISHPDLMFDFNMLVGDGLPSDFVRLYQRDE